MFFDYLILLQIFELFAAFDLYDYIESNLHFFWLSINSDGWQSVA